MIVGGQVLTPWLTIGLVGGSTPATLTLRAASTTLAPGVYGADVTVASTTDLHQPATLHVTLVVRAARRVVLEPKTVDLGTFASTQTTTPTTSVTVRSANVALSGLVAQTEYLGSVTGWLTANLLATTAAPTTTLQLTPRPSGLPLGAYQARVIVSSTTTGAGPDTVIASITIASLGRFSGLIQSATTGQNLAGVTIIIRRADNSQADQVFSVTDGTWSSNPIAGGTYSVTYSAAGYLSATLFNQVLTGSAAIPVTPLPSVRLVPSGLPPSGIQGEVRDATTNFVVAGATVELRAGSNNKTGTPINTTTTTANGTYNFISQSPGTYTIRATRTNFTEGSVTATAQGTTVTAPVTFLSPTGVNIAWRFVLSWGGTPLDLDGHLTGPVSDPLARFHVFWNFVGSKTQPPYAFLDQDATEGYGPETITIHQQLAGVYRYYVHNFSGSPELRLSTARVDVYQGNTLVRQFFPPQTAGVYWTVFEINGSTLTPINTTGSTQPSLELAPVSGQQDNTAATRAEAEWFGFAPWMWVKPARIRR